MSNIPIIGGSKKYQHPLETAMISALCTVLPGDEVQRAIAAAQIAMPLISELMSHQVAVIDMRDLYRVAGNGTIMNAEFLQEDGTPKPNAPTKNQIMNNHMASFLTQAMNAIGSAGVTQIKENSLIANSDGPGIQVLFELLIFAPGRSTLFANENSVIN
jgi:hypothetical protein